MDSHPNKINRPLVTLGPVGTDAEALASRLALDVRLVNSFREAMDRACTEKVVALVACGHLRLRGSILEESWTELHFEYCDRLRLVRCFSAATKPMCIAVHADCDRPRTIAIHPATKAFAKRFAPGLELRFVGSKPLAVSLCLTGDVDMCIGSVDVVQQHPTLRVLQVFRPSMVWALYSKVGVGQKRGSS